MDTHGHTTGDVVTKDTVGGIEPIFTSVEEAAAALSTSRWAIYQLIKSGDLRSLKQGTRRLVVVESIREYAARLLGEAS